MKEKELEIKNFAHIENASLSFGDLTVLIGAQGTGKSLALQWFKTALDGRQMVTSLRQAGQDATPKTLVDQIFGVGMGSAWKSNTSIRIDKKNISPKNVSRLGGRTESAFFIPAHRSMLISDGWAAPFQKLTADTPVVARLFSQNLFDQFAGLNDKNKLFPQDKVLKKEYRKLIDRAVFHGGTVGLERDVQHAKRLKLAHGEAKLPFMTWTAGQREFTPLLLGLYHLLPGAKLRKRRDINWVIIEEPEMGLHPQAISVFMLLVLDLIWRGYKVILSTHSQTVLSVVWMLRRLKELNAPSSFVCEAFGLNKTKPMKVVAESALQMKTAVYLMRFNDQGRIYSKDISTLDPGEEDDDISGWGGLTGFSSDFGAMVRKAVNLK